jgi:hypothetical protein
MLPKWNNKHLRYAIEGAVVAFWAWNVDSDKLVKAMLGCYWVGRDMAARGISL